jgi:hypothetical protein
MFTCRNGCPEFNSDPRVPQMTSSMRHALETTARVHRIPAIKHFFSSAIAPPTPEPVSRAGETRCPREPLGNQARASSGQTPTPIHTARSGRLDADRGSRPHPLSRSARGTPSAGPSPSPSTRTSQKAVRAPTASAVWEGWDLRSETVYI